MKEIRVKRTDKFKGEIVVPGDKSISHRAIMLGALANGETIVHGFLNSADCIATAKCFRQLGVDIEIPISQIPDPNKVVIIKGRGLHGLSQAKDVLDVGNSGTTIRLMSGILAGQGFESTITGDSSIQKRPMKRVAEPLVKMGAMVNGQCSIANELYPPLKIKGGNLHGIEYKLPMASAQVKSAILFAGLYAKGTTTVIEPVLSRDHTERMLAYFGVPLKRFKNEVAVELCESFEGREVFVPGDISSAAFFMAAGLLIPGSDIIIRDVGTNPTRTGILDVLHRMGGDVRVADEEMLSGEPRAKIQVKGHASRFADIELKGEIIPRIIDEIPIIAVLATKAKGDTIIRQAQELRVKESDRIKTISSELRKMGVKIDELPDGMIIHGPAELKGARVKSYGDHRIAMSLAIAGLIAEGETIIEDTECIETSFPGFEKLLLSLRS